MSRFDCACTGNRPPPPGSTFSFSLPLEQEVGVVEPAAALDDGRAFTPPLRPDVEESFIQAGGEMGALMRSIDWSKNALGPLAGWPQSLRTSVSTMLRSP